MVDSNVGRVIQAVQVEGYGGQTNDSPWSSKLEELGMRLTTSSCKTICVMKLISDEC
jgi:hypothetical protein